MDFVTILSYLFGEGEETQQKLRSANCTTPERLSALNSEKLSGITGLSLSHSECMINYAMRILRDERNDELKWENSEEAKDTAGSARTDVRLYPKGRAVTPSKRKATTAHKVARVSAPKARRSTRESGGAVPASSAPSGKRKRLSATRSVPDRSRPREKPRTSPENVKSFWRFG
jgi:hypothetical protein